MNLTMTAPSATTTIINDMKILSLGHDHDNTDYYYPDDTTSDSTVTATVKDFSRNVTEKSSNDWIDEIEHSFESSCNGNNYSLDDFNAHETTIMQSYLEPNCPHIIQQPPTSTKPKSKFSVIKQKMKRVFCMSPAAQQHTDKNQLLMQSSLPVLPTVNDARWNQSIDSSICSSSTLRPPDQTSTHSSNSNASSYKSHRYRNSCGFQNSSSSSHFNTATKPQQQRRHSTVSKIKDRFSRTPSLGTLPISNANPPIKGILKKQMPTTAMRPPLSRPTSVILSSEPLKAPHPRHPPQKRWSTTRFSVHSSNHDTKKRYTVLSLMNNKRKSQPLDSQHLKSRTVRFNKQDEIHETYARGDYDRSSDPDAVCTRLTAPIATQIKQELNYFKLHEMIVHDSSRHRTHFFF